MKPSYRVKHGDYWLQGSNGWGAREWAGTFLTEGEARLAIKKLSLEGAEIERCTVTQNERGEIAVEREWLR